LAAELYVEAGIRAMERGIVSAGRNKNTGDHYYPELELLRLTIPRRVYTQAHMDLTAEAVEEVYLNRDHLRGLKMIYEPKYLRFFQAKFELC
jgi:tyrosine phenol-lyase